jgi:hypothetical protein
MIETVLATFPNLKEGNCYRKLAENSCFLEDIKDKITKFNKETEYWNLCLENKELKTVLFLENEFSVMKNEISKKCDWVFAGNQTLYFVESKDVKPRNRNKERKDAIKQLIATIEFYKSKMQLENIKLHSQICFKSKSKIIKSADQARKKLFEQYNSTISEGNHLII